MWSLLVFSSVLVVVFSQANEPTLSIHRVSHLHKTLILNSSEDFEKEFKNINVAESLNEIKNTAVDYDRSEAVIFALTSAMLVGLSGIFPLLILSRIKIGVALKTEGGAKVLNRLLSFAVGGLLGDVFLHLLPESWNHLQYKNQDGSHNHWPAMSNGLWILFGLISFLLLEKAFPETAMSSEGPNIKEDLDRINHNTKEIIQLNENGNNNKKSCLNGISKHCKGGDLYQITPQHCKQNNTHEERKNETKIKASGYLNLLANCIDNFTHGLAVGGSYLVSRRVGVLTTMAILLHEIPHEIGDFAILLRAGFNRWEAAKLQVLTASGGILGAIVALASESAKSTGDQVSWILPFTSGGFIYVALCTVVPDILKEKSPRESLIQILFILLAICIMQAVSFIE